MKSTKTYSLFVELFTNILVAVQWAGHAGLLWELHEQELSRLNDDRREKNIQHARTVAVLTKQLGEEREHGGAAAAQERDAAAAQLRAAQEVRTSLPEKDVCFFRSLPPKYAYASFVRYC